MKSAGCRYTLIGNLGTNLIEADQILSWANLGTLNNTFPTIISSPGTWQSAGIPKDAGSVLVNFDFIEPGEPDQGALIYTGTEQILANISADVRVEPSFVSPSTLAINLGYLSGSVYIPYQNFKVHREIIAIDSWIWLRCQIQIPMVSQQRVNILLTNETTSDFLFVRDYSWIASTVI